VIKHYQWMLRTDFLPRIVAPAIVDAVFAQGRKAFEAGASPASVPTMPIEFSVAAYRLGHSMIRETYNWNRVFDDGAGTLEFLFDFSGGSGGLSGDVPLPTNWIADFRRLYDFGEAGRADLKVPARRFNRAMRIDTTLVDPLRAIRGFRPDRANLAFRNLTRASQVSLATGQQMVDFMRSKGLAPTRLTEEQILDGRNGADLGSLNATQRTALVQNTPLWFYILREAEFNQGVLRNVGGRIVAETFHRAIEGSRVSILRDPAFRPSFGPDSSTFRMVDLLLFAFQGREALLNPLGD
jgi:hypothetical protein